MILFIVFLLFWCASGVSAAVDCDGVDDVLPTGLSLDTFVDATSAVLMTWYTPSGTAPAEPDCTTSLVQQIMGDADGFLRLARMTSTTLCNLVWVGGSGTETTGSYSVNVPVHIAAVLTGGNHLLYINGVQAATVASNAIFDVTFPVSLCGGANFGAATQGRINEARTYGTTVPSAGELAAIAQSRTQRLAKTTPTGWWDFNECTPGSSSNGIVFRDTSWNGRPITGDDGANNTGLTCQGGALLRLPGGMH